MLDQNIDYNRTPLPHDTTFKELEEWRRARDQVGQLTMNESPLIAPTYNFTDPMPFPAEPATIKPTPNYSGSGTHNEEPLLMPIMNFDGDDVANVNAPAAGPGPSHQQTHNNATGGNQGGESPLLSPDWGWG